MNEMNERFCKTRSLGALLAAASMAAAACSGSATTESIAAGTEDELVAGTGNETAVAGTEDETAEEETGGGAATVEMADANSASASAEGSSSIEPAGGPMVDYVSSAMGGVRFEAPEGSVVLAIGDGILVSSEEGLAEFETQEYASVVLVTMFGGGGQLESAEQYLDAVRGAGVEVAETGTTVELAGYELVGYEMTGGDPNLYLFAADRFGAPVQNGFGPLGHSLEFIADTPAGVLSAGVAAEEDIEPLLPLLGTLLESVEMTGPGLDAPLPAGEEIVISEPGAPPAPAEASGDPDGLPELGESFSPLAAGRYELLNFGLPVSVEVPDDWFVQPNAPGIVVLSKAGSIGPGDRDLVWINDIRELTPIAGGPTLAGSPRSVDDIEAIIADPPSGLVVDDVERSELTAPDGETMPVVSFRVSADPSSACTSDDPCDYAFLTSYGVSKQLLSTSQQRVWFFPEHPSGPSAAVAQGPFSSDFVAEAEAVMATMELSG